MQTVNSTYSEINTDTDIVSNTDINSNTDSDSNTDSNSDSDLNTDIDIIHILNSLGDYGHIILVTRPKNHT